MIKRFLGATLILSLLSFLSLFIEIEPPPTDLLMLLAIFGWLIYLFKEGDYHKLNLSFGEKAIGIFGVFNLFQLTYNHSQISVFWVAVTSFLILGFFLLKYLSSLKDWLEVLWHGYLIASIISTILMLVGFISYYTFNILMPELMQYGRAKGLFKDPNVAGPFIIPAFIYLVSRFFEKPSKWTLLGANLTFIAIFFSLSRAALVNLAVAVILLIIFAWRLFFQRKLRLAVLLATLAVSSLFILTYAPFFNLAKERFTLLQQYDQQGRLKAWQSTTTNVSLGGSGPGTFESNSTEDQLAEAAKRIRSSALPVPQKVALTKELNTASTSAQAASKVGVTITPSAHNTYLRILEENGLIGIGLILLAIGGILITVLISARRKGLSLISTVLFVSYLGILANGFFIDTLHWRLFWYIPALLLASLELKRAED